MDEARAGDTGKGGHVTRLGRNIVTSVMGFAIRFMCATVRFRFDSSITGISAATLRNDMSVGFWHGDTQGALALLRHLRKYEVSANIIVTADWRGDVIDRTIKRYGHRSVRMPDGLEIRHFMSELKKTAGDRQHLFALSMDGPLGPKHEPKKILFRLSADERREVVVLSFDYSRAIRLGRWDSYAIPLPFSRVTMRANSLGTPTRAEVKDFDTLENSILRATGIK